MKCDNCGIDLPLVHIGKHDGRRYCSMYCSMYLENKELQRKVYELSKADKVFNYIRKQREDFISFVLDDQIAGQHNSIVEYRSSLMKLIEKEMGE